MAALVLNDMGERFMVSIESGGHRLACIPMDRRMLREAARLFDRAQRTLQSRDPRPEGQEGPVWLPG